MEHGSRTRLLTAVVLAAVFGSGVLIGFAADSNLGAEPAAAETVAVVEEEPERERRTPLYMQLEPTAEQQATIDSIISVHRERTNALDKATRRTYRDGFRVILVETREAIKQVFTPEEGEFYQHLLDAYDAEQAAERESKDERN